MDLTPYLEPNEFIDSTHPAVIDWNAQHVQGSTPVEQAVSLFYAVRDGFRYNPYWVSGRRQDYRASLVAQRSWHRGGHCIDKGLLLAACARVCGIPARMHFATVRNHLSTERLERELGTDLLVFHGYCSLLLEERWVKLTPAFNKELCDMMGVEPLEFDGEHDAIFQQFGRDGSQFMDYVHDYGHFPGMPFEQMLSEWRKYYGDFLERVQNGDPSLAEFHWEIDPG